jgi:uncharacterized protein (DUF1800 family)
MRLSVALVLGGSISLFLPACSGCSKKAPPDEHGAGPAQSVAVAAHSAAPAVEPVAVALPETRWPKTKQAFHVLDRLAYGPRPGEVEKVAAEGVAKWIGAQLRPAGIADRAVEDKLRKLPALSMSIEELHETYPQPKPMLSASAAASASAAPPAMPPKELPQVMLRQIMAHKILRATESERQLQEVLVDFWFNHFNVAADKEQVRYYVLSYEREALRPFVFGKFRELLGATARHPAMLQYLDNFRSTAEPMVPDGGDSMMAGAPDGGARKKGGLNENYGRELLELHTLGVDGGYTQDDVRETARAFTGWGIDQPGRAAAFRFHPKLHDNGEKHILGKLIEGGGEKDGERVLDLLAAHPATARFIATKLCQKFHSDKPPAALVQRVAQAFTQSGGDLTRTYLAIFTAPEFWSDQTYRSKTKTPFELVTSALRAVGASTEDAEPTSRELDKLGEPLYRCAPPTGYKETADAWVSTGGLLGRINFGLMLGAGRLKGVTFDRDKLVGTPFPADDEALVERLGQNVLHGSPSSATRAVVVQELSHQKNHVDYGEPSPTAVPLALGLLLGSPEMQKQ